MLRLFYAAAILFQEIIWAQNLHPVSGRQLSALGGEGPERPAKPEQSLADGANTVLDLLGIPAGATVADVGAGTAEFTWRLAERVGTSGRVFAVDTQQAALDRIRKAVGAHGFNNVKITRGTEQDPKLPAAKVDLVLLAGAYHGFTHPQQMLRRIREALKPEGKLVVIEFKKEDTTLALPVGQRMTIQEIRTEIEPEGFKFAKVIGMLPREHIVIFNKVQ